MHTVPTILSTSFRHFSSFIVPVPYGRYSRDIISYASSCVPFTSICQLSLTQLRVPCSCSKWSAELPVASSRCDALADCRLFVLASLVMKSWGRLGKEELLAKTEHLHDPFPFMLRPNRVCNSVILLDLMFSHLEGSANRSEPCLVDYINPLFPRMAPLTSCILIASSEHNASLLMKAQCVDFKCKHDPDSFYSSNMTQIWLTCFLRSANRNRVYSVRILRRLHMKSARTGTTSKSPEGFFKKLQKGLLK